MHTSIIKSQQPTKYYQLTIVAILAVVIVPLLLAISWGTHFAHDVYETLQATRNLLWATNLLFIEPAPFALIMSVTGWSMVGLAYLMIGWVWKRPFPAAISTLLLSFNPFIIILLGSETSWMLALFWLTIALGLMHRWVFLLLVSPGLILLLWVGWPLNEADLGAIGWTIFLFLTTLGLDWLIAKLAARDKIRLSYQQTSLIILSLAFLVLGVWQIRNITNLYQKRPLSQWKLEQEIADWLKANTEEDTSMLVPVKISYLAQRPLVPSPIVGKQTTASSLLEALQVAPPDYLMGNNNLIWKNLEENAWFRLVYEPVQTFLAPHDPTAPYTIWAYRPAKFGQDERVSLNVRAPDRLWILGYEMMPNVVQAGESIEMILYLRTLEATVVPLTSFTAIIRLVSPIDNTTITEWQIELPQTISVDKWRPDHQIGEQFSLPLPAVLEPGGYLLNLSLIGADQDELWPFSRDNDVNALDRIPLEFVAVPQNNNLADSIPFSITFANSIQLNGFNANEPQPGSDLNITLHWQADEPSPENYVVFVHLLDENGQLITNHDGAPGNGRFPTTTWHPGIIIQDNHTLSLPPNMSSGTYQIKVGLYHPETGERLPPINSTEEALLEKAIPIMQFQIP